MADKAISELVSAAQITPTDMFVLEQNGTAKKLTGQVLLNWLTEAADGHGGIQSIVKISTSGLVDTYRITLADTTPVDFLVTNGKGVAKIEKTSTSGLVDTYSINYTDGTHDTFQVTNGQKGDPGDNQYIWIKYASVEPTESSHSMGDLPDEWIGIYSGASDTAPTDWKQYTWYKIRGDKGDPGEPAQLMSYDVDYQSGDSGTTIPSGSWTPSIPVVVQGKYLWTRIRFTFNTGVPVVVYNVSRMGMDGLGSVISVNNVAPDTSGNVPLKIGGSPYNCLHNSDFERFVAQAGIAESHGENTVYAGDRWILDSGTVTGTANADGNGYSNIKLTGTIRQIVQDPPAIGTAAINMVSGTAQIDYRDGAVTITSDGGVIKNARLFEGTYTTETMPEYQPRGYGAELMECLRYFWRPGSIQGFGFANSASLAYVTFVSPVIMRVKPTLIATDLELKIRSEGKTQNATEITTGYYMHDNTHRIGIPVSGMTANQIIQVSKTEGTIDFNADL